MDRSIPKAAVPILEFLGQHETRGNYEAISSFKQDKLPKKLTSMTVDEILKVGVSWIKQYGTLSSAAGKYQIINKTLRKLKEVMNLKGNEKFTPDLQDRMAMQLLRFRGYDQYMAGNLSVVDFGKNLAMEWASMPVLAGTKNYRGVNIKRGASYYAGDGLNAAARDSADEFERILRANYAGMSAASPRAFSAVLQEAHELPASTNMKPADTPVVQATKIGTAVATGAAVVGGAAEAGKAVTDWQPVLELVSTISRWGPAVAGGIVLVVVAGVIVKKVWGK